MFNRALILVGGLVMASGYSGPGGDWVPATHDEVVVWAFQLYGRSPTPGEWSRFMPLDTEGVETRYVGGRPRERVFHPRHRKLFAEGSPPWQKLSRGKSVTLEVE